LRTYVQCVIGDSVRLGLSQSYHLVEGAPHWTVSDQSMLVRISVRRIKIAMASGRPAAATWTIVALRLNAAARARASPA